MRMNRISLALALALAVLVCPLTALAQDAGETPAGPAAADSSWSWSVAATSDYVFRGVTQTHFGPALQAGLKYSFGDSGWYAGSWASNVDYNAANGPDLELDAYVGLSRDLAEDWNLDLSLIRYSYLGADDGYGNVDYNELVAKTTWDDMLSFTVAYANDYGNADFSSLYLNLGGSWEVGHDLSLVAGFGHTQFSGGNGDYTDWTLGLGRQFGPVNATLNYYDTNLPGSKASDAVVLTLSLGN